MICQRVGAFDAGQVAYVVQPSARLLHKCFVAVCFELSKGIIKNTIESMPVGRSNRIARDEQMLFGC